MPFDAEGCHALPSQPGRPWVQQFLQDKSVPSYLMLEKFDSLVNDLSESLA